ncbi:MAG: hypothetical protein ABGX05_08295 [Pirellulaceae bacterium]
MKKILSILSLLSLVVGCGKSEQAQEGPGGEPTQNQQQQTEKQPSAETQQEAIAALEQLGATIGKDENGNVVSLSLIGTKITDAGLVHLKRLTKLQRLGLEFTKVTDAGVADLQKALPNCKISR